MDINLDVLLANMTPEELAKVLAALKDNEKQKRRKVKRKWIVLGIDMKPIETGLTMSDAKALSKHIAGGCITTEAIHKHSQSLATRLSPRSVKGRMV